MYTCTCLQTHIISKLNYCMYLIAVFTDMYINTCAPHIYVYIRTHAIPLVDAWSRLELLEQSITSHMSGDERDTNGAQSRHVSRSTIISVANGNLRILYSPL